MLVLSKTAYSNIGTTILFLETTPSKTPVSHCPKVAVLEQSPFTQVMESVRGFILTQQIALDLPVRLWNSICVFAFANKIGNFYVVKCLMIYVQLSLPYCLLQNGN